MSLMKYTKFITELRQLELRSIAIELNKDITPMLKWFIREIQKVKYEDGYYHCFYNDIKVIIKGFINFWNETIDETLRIEDKHSNNINKKILLDLIDNTIKAAKEKNTAFEEEYKTFNDFNEDLYNDLKKKYEIYLDKLNEMEETVNHFDRQEQTIAFVEINLKGILKKTYELLDFTHSYIGLTLTDFVSLQFLQSFYTFK